MAEQITLLFRKQKTSIGSIEIDASISETHVGRVEVTDHPVEQGAAVSDHARVLPETLTLEGFVSNTPLPVSNGALTRRNSLGVEFDSRSEMDLSRAGQAYTDLVRLKNAGELFSIVTMLRSYDNMLMTSLDVPRDAATGDGLRFSASFKQVRVAESRTVQPATTSEDKTRPKTKLDKKAAPTTPAPVDGQARSVAHRMVY